ncbi:MAG TPA: glycosyltransferase family 4 protein [Gaiellaceae bacterium]|nr:glycosyltransferase family 4 protein [Gaiellaceae bacterium]
MTASLPRVLLVGRARFRFPLEPGLEHRFAALSEELDWRQLGTRNGDSPAPDDRFVMVSTFPVRRLEGLAYHLALPFRVRRELRRSRPDVAIVQGAPETALVLLGRALSRVPTRVVLDLHGDWRATTRLYGSRGRRLLDPLADALARRALRRADGVRTITAYTTGLVRAEGIEPVAEFPAYMDLRAFTAKPVAPLPETPRVLFVGVLERYKAFDVLADAWRRVAAGRPDGVLHVVGRGTLAPVAERLVADLPERVEWTPWLTADEVSDALDAGTVLVLPSRSEGMGRVVIEAGLRGRGVVASRVGGIPDVARDGETGLLVPPGDATALADALDRVLADPELAGRFGAAARSSAEEWHVSAEEYARRLRALVDDVLDGPRRV